MNENYISFFLPRYAWKQVVNFHGLFNAKAILIEEK